MLFIFFSFFFYFRDIAKNNGILHSLICFFFVFFFVCVCFFFFFFFFFFLSEFPFNILNILETHRILVAKLNIILDISLFIYFLSFTLFFFAEKEFSAHLGM